MTEPDPRGVQALFLHDRLLLDLLAADDRTAFDSEVARLSRMLPPEAARAGAFEDIVARLLQEDGVEELSVVFVEGRVEPGSLVTLTQDFYIRRANEREGRFRAGLDVDRQVKLEGRFSIERTVGTTGETEIFGHRRLTMIAYVEAESRGGPIKLRPLFIGWRVKRIHPKLPPAIDDRHEVWPGQLDQFSAVSGAKRPRKKDLETVAKMPEADVKDAFAQILGEPFVPKDWAGEKSDLFTANASISGRPLTVAFAFKGPGERGPLYIAGMGKRGDQALRLASEPADLIVVQHHDRIDPAVRALLSALARREGKRFMVIDGPTTAAILRAYDKLPE